MQRCHGCGEENPERARFCLSCGRAVGPDEIAESRRPVTTLFCDLVASTELSARLDAEALHRVMGRFYETARAAVERHGGTVEKFAGDAVMGVYGFPRLHEDDPLRAARSALELRRAIVDLNEDLEREWGVRIDTRTGIATGEVLAGRGGAGEPFVIGASVNLAARLEQHAGASEIALDEVTARRIRRAATLERVPPLRLKGFDGETPAFLLADLAPAASVATSGLVDRVSERRLLLDAYRGVVDARRCRAANLVGDAGIGKTRLIDAFTAELAEATVVHGRCPAYGEGASFRAFAEIVAQAAGVARSDPEDVIYTAVAAVAGDDQLASRVLRTVGLVAGAVAPEEAASSVRTFLVALARRRPLVVVVDDVHQASDELLDVLEHVVEWSRDAPILLLCAARPELFFDHPTWGRLRGGLTLHLEALDDDDASTLLRSLLPGASPEVERRIVEVAGGNAFFVEEMAATVQEQRSAGQLTPEQVPVPPTITALLEARVDRLGGDERRALERAAVLGAAFTDDELEPLVGDDTSLLLTRLWDRDLIMPDPEAGRGGWAFRHALVRDAAYAVIPKAVRADLHLAVARALQDDARAGFHLEHAVRALQELGLRAPSLRDMSIEGGDRLARAGREASTRGDVASAAGLLERAAALLRNEPERLAVLADLHHARMFAGRTDRAAEALDELLAAFGPEDDDVVAMRARMQHAHFRLLTDPASMPLATYRAILDGAVRRFEAAGDEADMAVALIDLALTWWVEGHASEMEVAAARGLEAAERSGDRRLLHEAAALLANALLRGDTPLDEGLTRLAAVRARLADDRLTEATLRLTETQMLSLLGREDHARTTLAAVRAIFEDLGQRRWLAAADDAQAELERRSGRPAAAMSLKREVYAFFVEQGDALNALPAAAGLADLLVDAGGFDEAAGLAADLERQAGEDLEVQVAWRTVRAATLTASGERADATRLAHEALALADRTDFVLMQADVRAAIAVAGVDGFDAERLGVEALARYAAKGGVRPPPGFGAVLNRR
jgi:class 3 adenylate cyclase/tetratricopeptide (TPR) repeat protein